MKTAPLAPALGATLGVVVLADDQPGQAPAPAAVARLVDERGLVLLRGLTHWTPADLNRFALACFPGVGLRTYETLPSQAAAEANGGVLLEVRHANTLSFKALSFFAHQQLSSLTFGAHNTPHTSPNIALLACRFGYVCPSFGREEHAILATKRRPKLTL